jgi:amino acid permease
MRFFSLLNFQHVMGWLFPTLIFIVVFGVGLGYMHFRTKDSAERLKKITYTFPEGIEDRNAPFPLVMLLILAGAALWEFFYILGTGLLGVKI